ncbi:hypothetical protein ACEPAI_8906 [Sanghuangporus weigelae]
MPRPNAAETARIPPTQTKAANESGKGPSSARAQGGAARVPNAGQEPAPTPKASGGARNGAKGGRAPGKK